MLAILAPSPLQNVLMVSYLEIRLNKWFLMSYSGNDVLLRYPTMHWVKHSTFFSSHSGAEEISKPDRELEKSVNSGLRL